jgi:hypothetical protein
MARRLNAVKKQAVIRAILEGGMDSRQASEAAARGELGLEPFEIAPTTARDLASKARRAWDANGSKVAPSDDEQAERAWLQAEIDRILALERPPAKEIRVLRQVRAALDEMDRRADRRAAFRPPPEPEGPGDPSPLLERMLASAAAYYRAVRNGERPPCGYWADGDGAGAGPMPGHETRPCVHCGKQRDEHELIHPRCYGDGEWVTA